MSHLYWVIISWFLRRHKQITNCISHEGNALLHDDLSIFCCSLLDSIYFLGTQLYWFLISPTHPVNFKTVMKYFLVSGYGSPWLSKGVYFWISKIWTLCSWSWIFSISKYLLHSYVSSFVLHIIMWVWGKNMNRGTMRGGKSRGVLNLLFFSNLAEIPKLFHCWNLISYL